MNVSESIMKELVENHQMGMESYIEKSGNKIVSMPNFETWESGTEGWEDVIREVESNRKNYIRVEVMSSHEQWSVMEVFATGVDDRNASIELRKILYNPKPFRNFRARISTKPHLVKEWNEFETQAIKQHIERQIELE